MMTENKSKQIKFQDLGRRNVIADFSGGHVTSDAGALLLREVATATKIIQSFAGCFKDFRNEDWVEHTLEELLGQRIFGIALGYEDLNDHDQIRRDPLLAAVVGKIDPTGEKRKRNSDCGAALAGKSTLNRLELSPPDADKNARYKKIVYCHDKIENFFVDKFIESRPNPPKQLILDLDATDDPLHGKQEGAFFHGYYRNYCYLPLYIFTAEGDLLCAKLRPSNIDAAKGSVDEVERIVAQIRKRWPNVQIILRGDSGFARDEIMTWCEDNNVDYILGLAKNARLIKYIAHQIERGRRRFLAAGKTSRRFRDFTYQTQKSWSCKRRVVGKAEYLAKGSNPRFVVTSLGKDAYRARALYEELYCARGDMENRIKEQQLGLFADRTSTHTMRANQLRLWFSSIAYMLLHTLRTVGLKGTALGKAQVGTIRLKLLKIGAVIRITVRRVYAQLASAYPYQSLFATIIGNLRTAYAT